ncbi:MAG TPA: transcription termination factor NusA [Virgibacillus sp.]|nr:transcription termination factor NusA [Virgibacillus sp.]
MKNQLFDAIDYLEKEKGIDREVLLEALEAALISAYKKNFKSASNVRVDLDETTGSMHVYARKTVVEEAEDIQQEISLEEAQAIDPNYEVEDVIEVEVTPKDFGRIAAQAAKQVVTQRVREAERGVIFNEFADREEDVMTGIIQRKDARMVYVNLGKIEAKLAEGEQMPTEQYHVHDRLKVYVTKVENTSKGPQIYISRSHPGLLKRLFEMEVPEIYEGIVEIKSVSREAGDRSKISVHAEDPEIDPVGSCVGQRGQRVQAIVDELKGEKIDIVEYSEDPVVYVSNALSPSKVIDVLVDEEENATTVIVPDYQLSLAIGKRGQNARLAAKLTGWKIDIKSESEAREEGLLNDNNETVQAEGILNDDEPDYEADLLVQEDEMESADDTLPLEENESEENESDEREKNDENDDDLFV